MNVDTKEIAQSTLYYLEMAEILSEKIVQEYQLQQEFDK